MNIIVKNNFIKEDIVDEKGNKLGEIKFNPNDSRIMQKLTKIVTDLEKSLKKVKEIDTDNLPELSQLDKIEDFEKLGEIFETLYNGFSIELDAINGVIEDLSEIFGKDTIEIFTQGTTDANTLLPLLNFIIPYVQEYRTKKVDKYIPKQNDDVME